VWDTPTSGDGCGGYGPCCMWLSTSHAQERHDELPNLKEVCLVLGDGARHGVHGHEWC